MAETDAGKEALLVDERDQAYIQAMPEGPEREAIFCTVATYRRPDRLIVGDPVPALALVRLDTGTKTDLGAARDRPLVLFFGSYT
jgi:hypothetical protein